MNIVFDEFKYAETIIKKGLTRFMSGKDIRILIKYFRHIGIEEDLLYKKIVEFLNKFEPDFVEAIYQEFIYKLIRTSRGSELRFFQSVPFRKNEFNKIRKLNNYRLEKLLFTMLVLAKYFFITKQNKEEHNEKYNNYSLTIKESSLLRMAKISKRKNENLIYLLIENKFIFRTDNGNFILFFEKDDDSEVLFYIEDINKIYEYYKPHCEICGIEIEKRNNRHSMCSDCWKEVNKNQIKKRVERYRNKNVTV